MSTSRSSEVTGEGKIKVSLMKVKGRLLGEGQASKSYIVFGMSILLNGRLDGLNMTGWNSWVYGQRQYGAEGGQRTEQN